MAFSVNTPIGDGVTKQFAVSFTNGIFSRDSVHVFVEGEVDGAGDPIERTFTWINDGLIELDGDAPASGLMIEIRRIMDKDEPAVDFEDGEILTEETMDRSADHLLNSIHELLDGYGFGSIQTDINMNGNRVTGLPEPEAADDAARLADVSESASAAVLRNELGSSAPTEGSDLVAHTGTANTVTETLDQNTTDINQRVIYVGSVADFEGLSPAIDGQVYNSTGYHPSTHIGGGRFYWDSGLDKANHDGGTVIDPDKTFPADWSVAVDVTSWFTGDGVGTGCFVRPNIEGIMPQMYGAGAAIVDSSAPVQQAINYGRESYNPSLGKFEYPIDFGGKAFACAKSIDAVLVRQPGLTIKNGGIYSTAIGRIALDFAGTNEPILENFKVYGDHGAPPAVGIYHGRALINGGFPAAASAKFTNVDTNGKFGKASVINFASEVSNYSQCFYVNRSRSLTAYCYINCNNAQTLVDFVGAVSSDYATLATPVDGSFSNILHYEQQPHYLRNADVILTITDISNTNPAVIAVDPGDLTDSELVNGDEVYLYNVKGMTEINYRSYTVQNIDLGAGTFELAGEDATGYGTFTSGQVFNRTGPAVLLGGTHATTWESGYILTYGNDPVRIDLDGGTDTRGLDLAFHVEHSPKRVFALFSDAGNKIIPDSKIRLLQSSQVMTDEVFRINGSGGVFMNGLSLQITVMAQAPTNGLFASASKFQIRNAQIQVPLVASLDINALGSFTGEYYAVDTDETVSRSSGNSMKVFNDTVGADRNVCLNDRATTAQLEAQSDRVNTEDKYAGKMVWNTSSNSPVWATSGVVAATWRDATGAIVHTPV